MNRTVVYGEKTNAKSNIWNGDAWTTTYKPSTSPAHSSDTMTTPQRFPCQTTNIHYAGDKQFKLSSSK